MNPGLFLKISFPVILLMSIITLFLPVDISGFYALHVMQASLFAAFLLSLKVAFSYERELKKVFLYLAFFVLFLFFANLEGFWDMLYNVFGPQPYISLVVAGIAYVLLIRSCINILKITDFTNIQRKEWAFVFLMFALGNFIILSFILNYTIDFSVDVMTKLLFRIIDNVIVIMLLPVLFLYRKQSRMDKKESITFTVILAGIIISTIGDYVYEIVSEVS